jgi:hypothetical protein
MSPFLALFWLSLVSLCAAASRWGGRWEKVVAAMYLAAAVATVVARPAFESRYESVEMLVFAVDLLLFVGLAFVAVRCGLWWTICASALQCLTILAHLGKLLNPGLWRLGYQLMATWSAWPAVALLAVGIWMHGRRMPMTG